MGGKAPERKYWYSTDSSGQIIKRAILRGGFSIGIVVYWRKYIMNTKFKVGDEVFVKTPFDWEPGVVLHDHGNGTYCVSHLVCGMGEAIGDKTGDEMIPRDGTPFVEVH